MQIDMHYYGTYAIARAAGINQAIARTIATASQYVDDSDRLSIVTTDGKRIESEPTAHHPIDGENSDPFDQRRTWVPFHFIPGNEGATIEEKLICRTDSSLAREMIEHSLSHSNEIHGVLLLGITSHVYADTFSHYGFSGISSIENQIVPGSVEILNDNEELVDLLTEKAKSFVVNYVVGVLANFKLKLGHGAAATNPDQPYLRWKFRYEKNNKESELHDNPVTFILACRRLHEMFCEYNARTENRFFDQKAYRDFDDLDESVKQVLSCEKDKNGRSEAWQSAVYNNTIFNNQNRERIPVYDSSMFTNDLLYLENYDFKKASNTLVYLFLKAANIHREYIVNILLPKYGIHVMDANVEWSVS